MTLEELQAMSDAELNELAAGIMGYSMYHYDKDYEANCYFMLVTEEFDPVSRDVLSMGRCKTEAEAWKVWNPTEDMKDAMELTKWIDDHYSRHIYVETLRKVQGWNTDFVGNDIMYALIHSTPRERTLASILVKEE